MLSEFIPGNLSNSVKQHNQKLRNVNDLEMLLQNGRVEWK